MIKEKYYPYFCQPDGKEKFERFVRDFNIVKKDKIRRHEQYSYFCDRKVNCYLNDRMMRSVCDHLSVWSSEEERYVVFQSYKNLEQILADLREYPKFILNCIKYGHAIDIYTDEKYNWHNDNNIFILVTLDKYYGSEYKKDEWYNVNIHKENGTIEKALYKKESIMMEEDKEAA